MKFLITLIISFTASYSLNAETIKVAIEIQTGENRNRYYKIVRNFEKENPDIKVELMVYDNFTYKEKFDSLFQGDDSADIVWGKAGHSLTEVVNNGYAADISDLWLEGKLYDNFEKNIIDSVSVHNKQYAIPFSYYHWGFFYKKIANKGRI